jgi:hypothetical protein
VALFARRSTWLAIATIGVFTSGAIVWLTTSDSLSAPEAVRNSGDAGPYPFIGAAPIVGFVGMFVHTIDNLNGLIGQFGWQDTPPPTWVYAVWYVLFGFVAIGSMITLSGRRMLFVLALAGTFFLIPAFVQAAYVTTGGWVWQGRYSLPAFMLLVVGCAATVSLTVRRLGRLVERRLVSIIVTVWSLAQITCFAVVLRRYTVGSTGSWVSMFAQPRWQPPLGTVLLTVLFVLAVCSVAVISLLWMAGRLGSPRTRHAQSGQPWAPRAGQEAFAKRGRSEPARIRQSRPLQ